jgi:hypothetical protein
MRLEQSYLGGLSISRVAPGFQGAGTKASFAGFACDAGSENDWILLGDAQNAYDCSLAAASGTARARCRCEGGTLQAVNNHLNGHAISFQGGAVRDNTFSGLYLHDNAGPTPGFAFEIDGNVQDPHSGNRFESIQIGDAFDGSTWGLRLEPGGSDASNEFAGILCEDSAAAHCLEGIPPGAVVLP